MSTITLQQILDRRKDIEEELTALLEETQSDFTLEDVKAVIYDEDDEDDFTQAMAMFDNGQGLVEMSTVIEALSDAWNFFPHKSLNGLCPKEQLLPPET